MEALGPGALGPRLNPALAPMHMWLSFRFARPFLRSRGGLVGWTVEDNMVDGLFFRATLTGCRGGHTSFVQAGAETSDTGVEAVKPDPGSSWEGHSGWVGTGVGDENAESCGVHRPLLIPLVIRPVLRKNVVVR